MALRDLVKAVSPEFATDREIQGDQVDLKINDLRRDVQAVCDVIDGKFVGSAGGDLSGNYPNPSVAGIQGIPVDVAAPNDGDTLIYSGLSNTWAPTTLLPLTITQGDSNLDPTQAWTVQLCDSGATYKGATEANQITEIASLSSIDSKLTPPLAVSGPLTDIQLRASAVPVSVTSLPLPTGAATEATSAGILAELQANTVTGAVCVSPFGESITVEPSPRVQVDAVEGLLITDVETYTDGVSGSTSASGQLFVVTTGLNVGGYGTIRTRRQCKYRPGQGLSFPFTAKFSPPVASSLQLAGAFNACDGLFFGYSGTSWGILRRIPGDIGIYRLTLTAAPTGAETATITLNSVAFTVTLAATTVQVAAETIANRVGGYTGYLSPTANQATVTWMQLIPATAGGVYTFSSTGTAAGTITTLQAGAPNDNVTGFVPQANWNVDPMPGLDPEKLRPYLFRVGYLGAAPIEAFVMTDAGWHLVHRISYPGLFGVPSFKIPTLRVGWASASLGSTTNLIVSGASAAGFVLGKVLPVRDPVVCEATATATTTETAILSVRNRREFANRVNSREFVPIHLRAALETANRLVQVRVYINPTVVGAQEWSFLDQVNSSLEISTSAITITASTGRKIESGPTPSGAPLMMDLHALDIRLEPGDVMVVTIDAATNTALTTVSLSGLEE